MADREADLVPLMLRAQELGAPADWLVRAKHNRCLPDGGKLWQHTGAGAPIGELTFAMAARHGVKAREIATPEAVVELIDWYRARWEIEMLFDVLKNACRVEAHSAPDAFGPNLSGSGCGTVL